MAFQAMFRLRGRCAPLGWLALPLALNKMITKEQARELVAKQVCRRPDWLPPDDEIIIIDEATIEKPWGWVFFFSSKKWMETNDTKYAIAGNAPIIVEKATGKLITTGTARETEYYIENYERTGNPHG